MTAGFLNESAVTTLDGSGNGFAKVGPLSAREVWNPVTAAVSANANPTNEAQCAIYVGQDKTQSYFRDLTFTGSTGDSSGKVSGLSVRCGEYVWAVWSGGDAGATARLNVTGDKDV